MLQALMRINNTVQINGRINCGFVCKHPISTRHASNNSIYAIFDFNKFHRLNCRQNVTKSQIFALIECWLKCEEKNYNNYLNIQSEVETIFQAKWIYIECELNNKFSFMCEFVNQIHESCLLESLSPYLGILQLTSLLDTKSHSGSFESK